MGEDGGRLTGAALEGLGKEREGPLLPLIQILGCRGQGRGGFGRTENPATLLFLGAWGPGARA